MSLFGGVYLPGRPDPANIRNLDLLAVPLTRQMMQYGIAVDREYLDALTDELTAEMDELRIEICGWIPEDKLNDFIERSNLGDDEYLPMNVDSREQLCELLFNVLGVGAGKVLKMTKSGTRISTGKKQLERLKRTHEIVKLVLRYYERAKLKSTYSAKLPAIAVEHPEGKHCKVCGLDHVATTWRIHTTLLDTRTDTRRYASKNPNLQNIPARSELGRRVRLGFVAGPGRVLVGCDFSQIELRDMAHCANEKQMIRIYEADKDIHLDTAMRAFGLSEVGQVDKLLHRAPCKNVNFGIAYGLSEVGLLDQMVVTYETAGKDLPDEIDREWCRAFIERWFDLYPGMRDYMDRQHYRVRRYGLVWDVFGGVRQIPNLRSVHERVQAEGLRQAGNTPIQMCAAHQMKLAMAELAQDGRIKDLQASGVFVWPLLTIHDELIYEVDEEYGSVVAEVLMDVMDRIMIDDEVGENLFRAPIKSEAKVMDRWEKE